MPKELINIGPVFAMTEDGSEIQEKDLPVGAGLEIWNRVASIRWNRTGWVELGLDTVISCTGETAKLGHSGFYVAPDRRELNMIIRTLQKAGRQSYGVDPW